MEKFADMKNTYFLLGLDDHGKSQKKEQYKEGKKLKTYRFSGVMPLDNIFKKFDLSSNLIIIDNWLEIKVTLTDAKKLTLVNLIACADSSSNSLKMAQQLCKQIPFKKIINHPEKIEKTARSLIGKLDHLKNLIIPKSITIKAQSYQELLNAISENAIKFPLVIRIPHFHGGKYMKLLNDSSEITEIDDWFSISNSFNLSEYYNVQNEFGYYHKARFVVIKGKVVPRHIIYSKNWCIHTDSREKDMLNNEMLRNLEKDFLAFRSPLLNDRVMSTIKQIYDEFQLEIFGVDCALLPDGTIVIFEANAAMNFLAQNYGDNNEFYYLKPVVQKVERKLIKLIS